MTQSHQHQHHNIPARYIMIAQRNHAGRYPAASSRFGQPLVYITSDGQTICPACANSNSNSNSNATSDGGGGDSSNPSKVTGCSINYAERSCARCHNKIPASYL